MLQATKEYAFYCIPAGMVPDYELWCSEVGGKDVTTGRSITQQPFAGVFWVSANQRSWTAHQLIDIKFNLYRAKFKIQNDGVAVFRNEQDEYMSLTDIKRANTGKPIAVGDVVYAANSANTQQVLTGNTSLYPFGIVQRIDETTGIMYLDSSNGKFSNTTYPDLRVYRVSDYTNTSLIIENNRIANATLVTLDNTIYHGVVPKFYFNEPVGTYTTLEYYGTSNGTNASVGAFNKDISPMKPKSENLYLVNDYERVFMSYSNEVAAAAYGANGTSTFVVNMHSDNYYLSPVINLRTKTFNFIRNRINNDSTNEDTRYGNAENKYISRPVGLKNESEDLLVYITGYRPVGTDIKVYGKFLNSVSDPDLFDTKSWTELSYLDSLDLVYSSPKNTEDYREYKFGIPSANALPTTAYADSTSSPAGILTYTDDEGKKHVGFNYFAIKIVLLSEDAVFIPTMKDVRAIALQMG